jgi:hypothetical protein
MTSLPADGYFRIRELLVGESKASAVIVCREQASSSRTGIANRFRCTLEGGLTRSLCAHDFGGVRLRRAEYV